MNREDHIVHGFKATLVARAIYMLSSALLMFVLARYLLDPDGYGALYWAIGVLAIIQLFADLGLSRSVARYLSEYRETDPGQVPHLLKTTVAAKLVLITFVAYVLLLYHEWIATALGEPDAIPFLAAGVVYLVVFSFCTFSQVAFQGFNHLGYSANV